MTDANMTFEIKRRPLWKWLIGALWVLLEAFFLQAGFASIYEKEPRAAVFGFVVALLLLAAFFAFWRRK